MELEAHYECHNSTIYSMMPATKAPKSAFLCENMVFPIKTPCSSFSKLNWHFLKTNTNVFEKMGLNFFQIYFYKAFKLYRIELHALLSQYACCHMGFLDVRIVGNIWINFSQLASRLAPGARGKIKKERGAQKNEKGAGEKVKRGQGANIWKEQGAWGEIVKGARSVDPPNRGSELYDLWQHNGCVGCFV